LSWFSAATRLQAVRWGLFSDVKKVFKGAHWVKDDYSDILCLMYALIKIARQNPVELEGHIEGPAESELFGQYPRLQADRETVDLICDTFRSASMNYDDPHQVEEVLEKRIEEKLHHAQHSSHALQMMADGLPALGIVAAVLGVIKTMASIDQPPVGPFATKVGAVVDEDQNFYKLIREVLVASLHNHAPNICVEVGRQNTPARYRPSFNDLDELLRAVKVAPA